MHQFRDEWVVALAREQHGVPASTIETLRAQQAPFLAPALVAAGLVERAAIAGSIQARFRIPVVTLPLGDVDRNAVKSVPERICRQKVLLPFRIDERHVHVAMANPLDMDAEQMLRMTTGRRIVPEFCFADTLNDLIAKVLDPDHVMFDLLRQVDVAQPVELMGVPDESSGNTDVQAPVVRLVNSLIARAVGLGASDIHLEHDERATHVRFRVDGDLRPALTLPRYVGAGPAVSRLKIMANLDVAERRRPQDGRAAIRVGSAEVGLRVSTLPTQFGEKVVIRLLDARAARRSKSDLGFSPEVSRRMQRPFHADQGFVLVTGPTGSGKTTTLYAAIGGLADGRHNIVSVEDPIEYQLDGINQVQINEKQGLTFPSVLRSVLRQDPDTILIGEIRDAETAEVACQAAMTGHLVFSTLHTNDAASSVVRLVDMGVDRFKIAASLLAVTAQRLARGLCTCGRDLPPDEVPRAVREALVRHRLPVRARQATGCPACERTGLKGRVPLGEVFEITPAMRELISSGAPTAALKKAGVSAGVLYTLEADALWHLSEGHISVDEAERFLETAEPGAPVPARQAAVADDTVHQPAALPISLLVVDGDQPRRARVTELFVAAGFDVTEAVDGPSAITRIAGKTPGALVIASELPMLSGLDLIRYVRQGCSLMDVPILALCPNAAGRAEALAAGATDALTPAGIDDLAVPLMRAAMGRAGDFSPVSSIATPRRPANEAARLQALKRTALLDSAPEERFDKITRLAQSIFDMPIALVTLVDAERQWYKSNQGLDTAQGPRDEAFCAHVILDSDTMIVPDAVLDPRFAEHPAVLGSPDVRFYAGHPVRSPDGHNLGTLCVIDHVPRQFSDQDAQQLRDLAALVEEQIALSAS